MTRSYFQYWGKAGKDQDDQRSHHLLPYHCLDVAAVGQVLLSRHRPLRERLANLTEQSERDFLRTMVWFLSLHDIGKFSEGFQSLREDIASLLTGRSPLITSGPRHDQLGLLLWNKRLKTKLQQHGILPVERSRRPPHVADLWAMPVLGHHGIPPIAQGMVLEDHFHTPDDLSAALEFARDSAAITLGNSDPPDLGQARDIRTASWWMAGLAVLCDWLGSNADFFPFRSEPSDLAGYWGYALERAEQAIDATGILPSKAAPIRPIDELFSPHLKHPTPLQQLCADLPLNKGPRLFILEDVTGAGKTEAALYLCHRLLADSAAHGLYFGLPTMATANAMYQRLGYSYQRLYAPGETPALVLAHSARILSDAFRQSLLPRAPGSEAGYGDGTENAAAQCNAWLADNPKKALLATVGVGTIDQALLSILPMRHQSLRLLGLLDKLLVVDEVHAYDAYTNRLLCRLVQTHAVTGGSVLMLSATLPAEQRQEFIDHYRRGAGWTELVVKKTCAADYPLLTHCRRDAIEEIHTATRDSVRRRVETVFVDDLDGIERTLASVVTQGGCACWIRNTVFDARDTFRRLSERHPDWNPDLFHARYCLGDRLTIENRILDRFGRDSTPEQRRGQVLIATQVVEQSLDLDFDLMISDLAPIDSLIQRAGRLWRHQRPGTRKGTPKLTIYAPPFEKQPRADWFSGFFPKAAKIYANHGQLWLGAQLLHSRGGFAMPDDARTLIEGVYSTEAQDEIPETLSHASQEAEGDNLAGAGLASANAIQLEQGYRNDQSAWWEEANTPTRLGEDTHSVYLARWDGHSLIPWSESPSYPWQNSSLQTALRIIGGEAEGDAAIPPTVVIEAVREQLPAGGRWGMLLPLQQTQDGDWIGPGTDSRGEPITIYYDSTTGLMTAGERENEKTTEN